MPIQIIRKEQIAGTTGHIQNETYETYRFLLDSTRITPRLR